MRGDTNRQLLLRTAIVGKIMIQGIVNNRSRATERIVCREKLPIMSKRKYGGAG
jgi:hypothetical protein